MLDVLESFLGRNGFLPHGYCFQWSPGLLWTMVGSDTLIALAYFSIPLAILDFVRRRGGAPAGYGKLPWLFSAFIFSCGLTHVLDIWTLWRPDYGLLALSKMVTAGFSAATALALWPLIPRALKIPRVEELQSAIGSLEAEVGRRRSAEDHMRDSERSLALTLASVDAGFIATDAAGCVTRLNAVAERITGWKQEEARGRDLWEVIDCEDSSVAGRQPESMASALSPGVLRDAASEIWVRSRHGVRTLVELRVALSREERSAGVTRDGAYRGSVSEDAGEDAPGPVRGLVAVFRDMTRLREAEAELPRLAAIVASSEDAIIGKTLDGRITSWNPAASAMFGYTAEEAIGQPVLMLFPPERKTEELALLASLARGERVLPFHTERMTKDGQLRRVLVTISPIRDGAGRIVGASKIARDVSHLRRAEAALQDSQTRLEFALEAGQIGDWEFDFETGVTRRSLRHDRCFGYSELQPVWDLPTFLRHVHEDDRAQVQREFELVQQAGRDWHVEYRVVWPDGSIHWVAAHGINITQDGRPRRLMGIVIDITRHKRADEARLTALRLETENKQIQESSRLKSQFLANMSHELRTPLNAIIGFADLLQAGVVPDDSPKRKEFLGHISDSGRHLLQLINDVLDLSKVESGKFEFHPEPVDLARLVADVVAVLHTQLQGKQLELQIDLDKGIGALLLDPSRLKQALYNYVTNAIKFTPKGGRIWVRARAEGAQHFRLEVADTGIGIATDDLPRLFVEFQQLESGHGRQHQGTGLGLSLTRRLVEAQGGSVGVRSQPGQGSVFHLVLPRQSGQVGFDAALQLLLLDEDRPQRTELAQALRQAGCDVDMVADDAQALSLGRERAYDAIALDLQFQGRGGLATVAALRSDGASARSPVCGISVALGQQASAAFAVANVLPKPMQGDEVLRALADSGLAPNSGCRVMVIDDDPLALDLMHHTLLAGGYTDRGWTDGRTALADLPLWRPDAIVLDLMMPGFDGFAVLDALEQLPDWRSTPVFIWTSMLLTEEEFQHLVQTAQAVLAKGGGRHSVLAQKLRVWQSGRPRPAEALA